MLTKEEILKIAKLSRIELMSEERVEKFRKEVSLVLDYVNELQNISTEGIKEVSQVTGLINVQREDVAKESPIREEIFQQAPEMKDGYFKVKAIL